MVVAAPIEAVWNAYTTAEGWSAWASPRAEIDLRNGGTIRTAYEGEIGDEGTITLRIIGYSTAPEYERLLQFFIEANEGLFEVLRAYLEDGKRAEWSRGDVSAGN